MAFSTVCPNKILKGFWTSTLLLAVLVQAKGQTLLQPNLERIDKWQVFIDSLDGTRDGQVTLSVPGQTRAATTAYLTRIDQIQRSILTSNEGILVQKQLLWELGSWLQGIHAGNYHLYTVYKPKLELIRKCLEEKNELVLREQLSSNIASALEIIPFYSGRRLAYDVLKYAARNEPSILLKNYKDFNNLNFAADILDEVAKEAPLTLVYYLASDNPVSRRVQAEPGKIHIANVLRIFKQAGSASRVYLLMDDLIRNGMKINDAEQITRNRDSLYFHLIKLQKRPHLLGEFNVRDELRYLALLKVRNLNDLHELPETKRFESVRRPEMNPEALYYTMIYGEEEMYTSSFLGIYDVFVKRLDTLTALQFLNQVGMDGWPTFLRMCAAHNTITSFLKASPDWEIQYLFKSLCSVVRTSDNPLEKAVDLVDIYAELDNDHYRGLLREAVLNESKLTLADPNKSLLFAQIRQLTELDPPSSATDTLLRAFRGILPTNLFQSGEHVQQHFFYDDEDGRGSYYSFIQSFPASNWKRRDFPTYTIIESISGRKVKLYANKPDKEIAGQKDLEALFAKTGHFPDIVVHRGHSYYVDATIGYLTPAAQLVLLGSCGGYKQVNDVLRLAPEAQMVSTKQIGMRVINNALVYQLAEEMRTGNYLSWDVFWKKIESRFSGNQLARENFQEYIKPGDNLSVLLIRMYREALMY